MGCSDECPFRDHYETASKAWAAEIVLRQKAEAEVQERRAELVKVYNEGADAIAIAVKEVETLRALLLDCLRHNCGVPYPMILTLRIAEALGVPEVRRPTEAKP
jgi:hypothetical protein